MVKSRKLAILDPRLIPFFEMLTELGVDWLALEFLEGVQQGEDQVESERALDLARQRASGRGAAEPVQRSEPSVDTEPILGDAQLEWAARYVSDRLEAILGEMSESLDALDKIVLSRGEARAGSTKANSVLVLLDAEEDRQVDRSRVEAAQAQLPKLHQALESWLTDARPGQDS